MNKTKSLIFESAIKTFSESGYRGATMDDIASNAGLAKGTLYYNFASKEEIFNFIVEEGLQILQNQVIEIQYNEFIKSKNKSKASLFLPRFIDTREDKNITTNYEELVR